MVVGESGDSIVDLATALSVVDSGGTVWAEADRDVIHVSGADATGYLQGQISQNVERLADGETTWSFVLQPQGKVDGWFRLTRLAEQSYLIDLEPGFGQSVVDRLNRFRLRSDVNFVLGSTVVIVVRGADSAVGAAQLADSGGGMVVPAGWADADSVDVLRVAQTAESDAATAGHGGRSLTDSTVTLQQVDTGFVEWDRISRGLPAMGSELDDSTIPAAAGVVDVSVDFTKGCYVGQELVARVDSRGSNTPTKLVRFSVAATAKPAVGTDVTVDGSVVGRITSVASSGQKLVGLAYIKRSAFAEGNDDSVQFSVSDVDGDRLDLIAKVVEHSAD